MAFASDSLYFGLSDVGAQCEAPRERRKEGTENLYIRQDLINAEGVRAVSSHDVCE